MTKRTIDALKPDRRRDAFLCDAELRAFGVRMKPSGTKTFIIQYRNVEGRISRCVVVSKAC